MTRTRHFCLPLRTLIAILAIFCAALLARPEAVLSAPPIPPQSSLGVCSAILYDLDRDAILFEQNADQRIPPASLTKVMSMFLAMDQINSGLARLDSTTTISRNAARTGGSRMGLNENEQVNLEQLLTGMAVSSGNDASTAMAEYVGGSVPAFISMMNAKARELGMTALILMPDTACTDNYIKLAGAAAEGAICSSTSVPLGKLNGGGNFKTNYEKRFAGQTVQAYSPLTYDAVYVLADAIKQAGSTDKAKIAAAIPKVTHSGLTGTMAFDADGERKDAEIAILEEKGGKFDVIEMVK